MWLLLRWRGVLLRLLQQILDGGFGLRILAFAEIGAREPRYIKTLRNEGYVFSAAVTLIEGEQ